MRPGLEASHGTDADDDAAVDSSKAVRLETRADRTEVLRQAMLRGHGVHHDVFAGGFEANYLVERNRDPTFGAAKDQSSGVVAWAGALGDVGEDLGTSALQSLLRRF